MGKKHKVKYRIIPDSLLKDLVEFIDEMQFEAAKTDSVENHHLLNLCNYLISCLINSDGFTDDFGKEDTDDDIDSEEYGYEIPDDAIDWDSSSTDYTEYDFGDMSEEDYDRMMNEADKLFKGYNDRYKGKTKRVNGKSNMTLEQFKKELKKDKELTAEEKFELYYHERELRTNKLTSFDSMIKKLGLKKSKKNKK
jgi:hypothetical protein|tara:strand:- start:976 stop:1560 length:585 start_codon:yes stop_codon:yes gene_type:complete